MTFTTETILMLALLAGFIGFVIWFETKLAKGNNSFKLVEDEPINAKTLETMLREKGIEQYFITDESVIHFLYRGYLFCLDYGRLPIIRLGMIFRIDDQDTALAERAAEIVNNDWVNLNVQVGPDRSLSLDCITFTNGIYSLIGALPSMMKYLEQGYRHYGRSHQLAQDKTKIQIPIKTDKPS